jgi:cytidylate kinase
MLGYRYFDKGVMARMASEFSLTESSIVDLSEDTYKMRSFLDRFRGPRVVGQVRGWREDLEGRRVPVVQELNEDQAIGTVRTLIRAAYEDDNIVILGRGGQAILQGKPSVLHVRIEAPAEDRVARTQEQDELTQQGAERQIDRRDRAASDYLKRFYDIDWSDPTQYHLVINTGKWSTEAAAHLIVNAVSHLPPFEE